MSGIIGEEKMDKIIIIGGKGSAMVLAEQIYDTQIKMKNVEFLGFAFDDESYGKEINGFPVLCKTYDVYKTYESFSDVKFIFQLYRRDLMKERIQLLRSYGIPRERFATFIHHSVYVAKSARIGYGCVLMANVVVNSNACVGDYTTIQSNTLIGHDTSLGQYNFIAAHTAIGSNTHIGNGNFFGLNTSVNNDINIGDYNFIGMASNVVKGLASNEKVYGNPARNVNKTTNSL